MASTVAKAAEETATAGPTRDSTVPSMVPLGANGSPSGPFVPVIARA
nr:hypothetical protein [Luteimicrobium album]